MFLLSLPAIGQTNVSLEVSTKFVNFNFSAESEESIDEQIRRTKDYIEFLKETLPKQTKKYDDYLKEHSLSPIPSTENHEKQIRQLEKIKELLDLKMQTKLYQERLAEISRKEARLPYFSPKGFREIKNLEDAVTALSTAKKLVLYGDMVPGDWEEDGFGYPNHKAPALTIDDPEIIKSIHEFIKNGEFKFDPEWTQRWLEGSRIGTKQHVVMEVDDKAYIYILSDMMICEQSKTYSSLKYETDQTTYFQEQFWKLIPLDKHLIKRSQQEH